MRTAHTTIPLTNTAIAAGLQTAFIGKTVLVLDTVTSTNDHARGLSNADGPHGAVVIAEEQTAGRGRFGRRWQSSASMNLLFSVLLRPESIHMERIPLVPFAAALAVADAIESVTTLAVECKWPNDLLIAKKKVAGMLLESAMKGISIEKLVLGIGVNVNQADFPADILPSPTSLLMESGSIVDRSFLLQRLLEALEFRYTQLMSASPAAMLGVWKSRTTMFGTTVTVRQLDGVLRGIAEDIAEDGALLLRTDNHVLHTIRAGDVTLGYQQSFLNH
jgi:BirA family transcriptional regulator, biotin operon repressor / biotin---[acetyl-CoA-carboxylase] ligase